MRAGFNLRCKAHFSHCLRSRKALVPGGVWCSLRCLWNRDTAWHSRGFVLVYVRAEDICVVGWTLVSPKFICWSLCPVQWHLEVGPLGGVGSWEQSSHERKKGWCPHRRPPELLLPSLFTRRENPLLPIRGRPSLNAMPPAPWSWDFPTSRTVRKKRLFFNLSVYIYCS